MSGRDCEGGVKTDKEEDLWDVRVERLGEIRLGKSLTAVNYYWEDGLRGVRFKKYLYITHK